jgi:glucokinase
MIPLQERRYGTAIPHTSEAIIGADIGGTNSNFGIFSLAHAQPQLLFSLHAKSQQVTDFSALVAQVISYAKATYAITIHQALFACAGVVSSHNDRTKPTNLAFVIDAHAIKKATGLHCVYIVNDFEVIGYGLKLIDPTAIVCINNGTPRCHGNKAILGAGTGLGKCAMFWNESVKRYVPVPSEGGHADAALYHLVEYELAHFINTSERLTAPLSWEMLLSGNGIKRMYAFFHERAKSKHPTDDSVPHPDAIFQARTTNAHSADTVSLYTKLYARCAKNFALDTLALNGLYIAGGIAAHNVDMFKMPQFMEEFTRCDKQAALLASIPIYVITDYNVSLYGAAYYLYLEQVCPL